MADKLTVAKRPCGTCPYRRDVPSGVWAAEEYNKLPDYDRWLIEQPQARFDCHQRDGNLCAGWVAVHGMDLLILRLLASADRLDDAVYGYTTDVPLFASGREACEHGKRDIDNPSEEAERKIAGLLKLRGEDSDGTS